MIWFNDGYRVCKTVCKLVIGVLWPELLIITELLVMYTFVI